MVDRVTVKSRLIQIVKSIDRLERLVKAPKEDFLSPGSDLPAIVDSHLCRSLGAVFDVGRHLLAKSGGPELPLEYKSIATNLARFGIVPSDLEEALVMMARYRDRLVHFYHEITDEELHSIICNVLKDLRKFVESVEAYLGRL